MSGQLSVLVPAALGAGTAASAVAVVALWRGAGTNPEVFGGRLSTRVSRLLATGDGEGPSVKPTPQRAIVAGGVLVAVWIISGWPVAGIGCGVAVLALPWLLGSNAVANRRLDRIEALEVWCRGMADRLAGGGGTGLVQTIRESTRRAPEPIAAEVRTLAARLASMDWGYSAALQAFADDLDDPTGDDVAAALMLALDRQGGGVADVLRRLAAQVAREVRSRDEVEAERAQPRQAMRVLLMMLGLLIVASVFIPQLHHGYSTATGQIVMASLLAFAGLMMVRMRSLAVGKPGPRFLTGGTRS
jgi:tight adherence protein B